MGYLEERANLTGKVAAVVGGAAGVGAAATLALAQAGVDIALCDINADAVEATRAEVERLGRRVTGQVTDAWDLEQLAAFFSAFDNDFDRLDVLINVPGGVRQRAFTDATLQQWTGDIHRNLVWAMQSMSLAIPRIRAGGRGGSIVSFTTIEAHRGAAGYAAYAGAKAGLTNFSKALAVELGPEKIRVNLLAPDTTPSESIGKQMTPEALRAIGATPEQLARSFECYIPMVTPPPVDDLGDAVLFLASDLSRSITGTTLHVDGGTYAASGFLRWPGDRRWGPTPPPGLFADNTSD
jgi:NAD(P)-dependent dehydrogenase (short-subunit alcohol dehydrogenase family)